MTSSKQLVYTFTTIAATTSFATFEFRLTVSLFSCVATPGGALVKPLLNLALAAFLSPETRVWA